MGNEREHIDREMEQEHSELHQLLQRETMRVPDGYLESLQDSFLRIPEQQKGGTTRRLYFWAYAAAAVVVLGLCVKVFWFPRTEQPLHIALAEMDSQELEAYFDAQLAALSYEELYDYLNNSVQAFETNDLFETQFADTADVRQLLYDHIEEQVFTDAALEEEKMLEDHMIETVGEEAIDAFINSEFILDDLGL